MDKNIENIISNTKLVKYQKLSAILKYLFVDISKISQDKYYLIGSFALREHRNISDLDIILDYDEFLKLENLVKRNIGVLEFYNNQIRWFLNLTNEYNHITGEKEKDFSIEAFQKKPIEGFPDKSYSLSYLKKHNGFNKDMNGHLFFNMNTLLRWKQQMNRDKDKPDIELILSIISNISQSRIKTLKNNSKKTLKNNSKKTLKNNSKKTLKNNSKKK